MSGCGVWDLISWPGAEPRPPSLGVQSLSHWTTREVPSVPFEKVGWFWRFPACPAPTPPLFSWFCFAVNVQRRNKWKMAPGRLCPLVLLFSPFLSPSFPLLPPIPPGSLSDRKIIYTLTFLGVRVPVECCCPKGPGSHTRTCGWARRLLSCVTPTPSLHYSLSPIVYQKCLTPGQASRAQGRVLREPTATSGD